MGDGNYFFLWIIENSVCIPLNPKIVAGVVKCGGYRYEDGTRYIGDWNHKGQKHGMGHLLLPGMTTTESV